MPTFNRAHVLGRAVGSVLGQTYRDFELMVVDDGSRDETADVMATFATDQVRFLANSTNRGGNAARNQGVRAARGEIICFLDSDDEYLPIKLERIAAYFDAHPEIDLVLDSFEVTRASDGRDRRRIVNARCEDSGAFRLAIITGRLRKPTPAISARREALIDAGLFDESLKRLQDMDLLLKVARRHRCASIDEVLWVKHDTAEDAISATRKTYLEALIAISERHPDVLGEPATRKGLQRFMVAHFAELARGGEWRLAARDLRRAIAWGQLGWPSPDLLRWGLSKARNRPTQDHGAGDRIERRVPLEKEKAGD